MTILLISLPGPQQHIEQWAEFAKTVVLERAGGPVPKAPPDEPARPVFVTLERNGQVLSCQGSLDVRHPKMAKEVRQACADALTKLKFSPSLYGSLKLTLTIVERLEPLPDFRTLTPEQGLVLTSGGKTGIVLPFEGREPGVRLDWAHRKAGVKKGDQVILQKLIGVRCRV